MRNRRVVEEIDENGRKRTEIVEEAATGDRPPDEGEPPAYEKVEHRETSIAEEERHPWDVARGWVRTLIIWAALALVIVETLLVFRLGFLLANANPNNGFVNFIYDASGPLAEPFEGIASQSAVNGGVFDPATFIGMIVYFAAAVLFALFLMAITAGPSPGGRHVATRSYHTTEGQHE